MRKHHGARVLSDHVPISLEMVLSPEEAARRPRKTYFKMEFKMLLREDVLERAKLVWQEHPTWAKDKRKRWALALGRIRKLLMDVRDEDKGKFVDRKDLETRVELARRRVQEDQSEAAREEFEGAVQLLRTREHEEVEKCRRRCKITWLGEGEAPSKYFFARLRAKHAHEEMTALEREEDGQIIEEQEEILEEVQRFYQKLYTAEEETEEMLEKRRRVFGRIDRRISAADNRTLEEMPNEEFITKIVMDMPKEKSPGIDGVMVEILRIGWEFMKEDCVLMVQCFWDKRKLVGKDSRGVIKLLPKNDRRHLLTNWRPITLLTMTYKIIAKIIAVRLKGMLPGIIDTQQTGFVAGRNIIDNILSLRLGQEWAQVTQQNTIFVKLDFMKAYDRVAHGFLWDTLEAMGIEEGTMQRIQGLVEGGSSEVHINGSFTEEITVGRGVRQGCPLAPLLFAMTTQPLMLALREEERHGNIQGLNIGDGRALLHQLFADDTGICITAEEEQFDKLKVVIGEFEAASGACLNLQKSVVMQLRPGTPQSWMEEAGCEVASEGKSFVYLGVHTSSPVDEQAITAEIVKKLMKKLKHWSNRLLSWPAKTILLKHVLAATPLYQLLSVGLCKDGLEALEKLCRNFLWGWNEEGNPKQALVAWERIAQSKEDGGLGWTKFRDMADALNVGLVGRILEGGEAEWIQLARSFILRTLRQGSYQRECRQWSIHEGHDNAPIGNYASANGHHREWKRKVWKGTWPTEEVENLQPGTSHGKETAFKWRRSTYEWRKLLAKKVDFSEKMEEKWQHQSQLLNWSQRWKLLWSAPIAYRRKVWLWRILQRGLFTNARAAEMGLQDGSCKSCVATLETVEHALWDCRRIRNRREQLNWVIGNGDSTDNLLMWIDRALAAAKRNPAKLLICIIHCWTSWRERNEWLFNHKVVNRPVHILLREAETENLAVGNQTRSDVGKEAIEQAQRDITEWKDNWTRKEETRRRANRYS
ncbi:hypothetical protein R1sor_007928 [Riccia sorocarpa]|uniref:Reverse transcriptase domain-containing protein n=1 Tax=Riccia sorocarpa TaxID=122646 RepID=A0ABD3HRX2_9MARC